jgi:hypothetical protein
MCDYSLHDVATRPAQIGDNLMMTRFNDSVTRGFAAVGEPQVAVCLMPGTEIAFDKEVECQPLFDIGFPILPNTKIGHRLARFQQININSPLLHHDALEFPDGRIVLLTRLIEGQRATVLQLPAPAPHATTKKAVGRGLGSLRFGSEEDKCDEVATSRGPRQVRSPISSDVDGHGADISLSSTGLHVSKYVTSLQQIAA